MRIVHVLMFYYAQSTTHNIDLAWLTMPMASTVLQIVGSELSGITGGFPDGLVLWIHLSVLDRAQAPPEWGLSADCEAGWAYSALQALAAAGAAVGAREGDDGAIETTPGRTYFRAKG